MGALAIRFGVKRIGEALHGDVERPTGCCVMFIGGRLEYGAIWSDVLQRQNDTDVQMVNLFFAQAVAGAVTRL